MQTHAHKDFYQAVQWNYWLGATQQQNLMNKFKIHAIKFEEEWKTDVNNVKLLLSRCHLCTELWQILADTDSTGSFLHKIILQILVFPTHTQKKKKTTHNELMKFNRMNTWGKEGEDNKKMKLSKII